MGPAPGTGAGRLSLGIKLTCDPVTPGENRHTLSALMICSFRRVTSDPELYTPIAWAAETTCSSWALSTARAMSSFNCISLRPPAETPSAPAGFHARTGLSGGSIGHGLDLESRPSLMP